MTISERAELEALREFASKTLMNPLDRAFFNVRRIIATYPEDSSIRVLAMALEELKRSYEEK